MNARIDNSGFWMLFGLVVYLVPICVYLYQSRWLPRLVTPVLDRLRACPRRLLPIIGLFVANMVVIGGWKSMPDPDPYDLADISYPVAHPVFPWW